MEYTIENAVFIAGFTLLTWPWAKAVSSAMLIPPFMALLFSTNPVAGAFTGFVAVMFFGSLFTMVFGRQSK